jgi:hypothetical protein
VTQRPLGSIIIPAHNESAVIERCLDALLTGMEPGLFDVIVVCNGCTDGTADLARSGASPARVIELAEASKIAALCAGEAAALSFPRLYLDADVVLPGHSAAAVLHHLLRRDALAARPQLRYDTDGCSRWVKDYYAARVRVPGLLNRLWGAGVFGLSEQGRARFEEWPDLTADDLFVDSLFTDSEIAVVTTDPVIVFAPRTSAALLGILRRVARSKGSGERGRDASGRVLPVRQRLSATVRGLAAVVRSQPSTVRHVLVYTAFAAASRVRWSQPSDGWERDRSSRLAA